VRVLYGTAATASFHFWVASDGQFSMWVDGGTGNGYDEGGHEESHEIEVDHFSGQWGAS